MSSAIAHAELYRHDDLDAPFQEVQIAFWIQDCGFQAKHHASVVRVPSQKDYCGRHGVQRMRYPDPTEVSRWTNKQSV